MAAELEGARALEMPSATPSAAWPCSTRASGRSAAAALAAPWSWTRRIPCCTTTWRLASTRTASRPRPWPLPRSGSAQARLRRRPAQPGQRSCGAQGGSPEAEADYRMASSCADSADAVQQPGHRPAGPGQARRGRGLLPPQPAARARTTPRRTTTSAPARAGRHGRGRRLLREALRLKPDNAAAAQEPGPGPAPAGRLPRGWAEYEWRWRCPESAAVDSPQPAWDGSPLAAGRSCCTPSRGWATRPVRPLRPAGQAARRHGAVGSATASLHPAAARCPGIDRLVPRAAGPAGLRRPRPAAEPAAASSARPWRRSRPPSPTSPPTRAWSSAGGASSTAVAGLQGRHRLAGQPPVPLATAHRSIPLRPSSRWPGSGVQLFSLQKGAGREQLAAWPAASPSSTWGRAWTRRPAPSWTPRR